MKRVPILFAVCGLIFALASSIADAKVAASPSPSEQNGWERVADPETSNTRTVAGPTDTITRRIAHPVIPLADGYTYTSLRTGSYRALSSEIESNPHGVVWTPLDGVPSSGGVSWRALAWALSASGDVVTSFATNPSGSMVTGCPCRYYRLPKNTTRFVSAGGASPNGVVAYIVPDGKGRLYSETGFGFTIQRTADGGRSWSTAPGSYASNPYVKLNGQSGGLYSLAIINNELYTGGEGGIVKCDLDMKICAEVAARSADGFKRNVTAFASNGGPQTPATEIFELARNSVPTSKDAGLSLMKWDSASNTWNYVPGAQIPGIWHEAYVDSIWKLPGTHEYILTRYSRNDCQVLYTKDAIIWTPYDLTGLAPFGTNYRPVLLGVDPLNGSKFLLVGGKTAEIWVHK